jgi:RNA polymerase sigma-B factor
VRRPSAEAHGFSEETDTTRLLRAYREGGESGARQRLIELYVPLAETLARRYAGRGEDYDDLLQVACIGLINAIDRFKPERGDELVAFAVPTIAGEIRRHFRDKGAAVRLPRGLQELTLSLARARADLTARLGRPPANAELAEELGVDEREVVAAMQAELAAKPAEAPPGHPAGGEDANGLETAEDRVFLTGAFRGLDERERRILYLRYVRDLEPGEVARQLGISPRHLSRQTQAALSKLRTALESGQGQARLPHAPAEPKMAAAMAATESPAPERYLDRPYHIALAKDEKEDVWTAQVEELPGCEARAATPDEAARGIPDAMERWISDALAHGREVPEPRSPASHSGRLLVRMPQSLHAELARAAERDEVSLNQFITSSLASVVGWRRAGEDPDRPAAADMQREGRWASLAMVVNIVVLAVVAVVAVILLVVAAQQGF